jgi:hypothetical protein
MSTSGNKNKSYLILGMITIVLGAGVWYMLFYDPKSNQPAPAEIVASQPMDIPSVVPPAQSAIDGSGKASLDGEAPMPTPSVEHNITATSMLSYDDVFISFSKKSEKEKANLESKSNQTMMNAPDLRLGKRAVLPHGGNSSVGDGPSMMLAPLASGDSNGMMMPQAPAPLSISGIICSSSACTALTNKGKLGVGSSFDSESVLEITKNKVRTNKNTYQY